MANATARHRANADIEAHFDQSCGRNDSILASWQKLCRDLGAKQGTSITQCKKNLRGIFVNIVDFTAAQRLHTPIRTYASSRALNDYMRTSGKAKIFPLNMAKRNPILKWMLIEVR